MKSLSLAEALDDSAKYTRRHLLLGNGFSIACRPNIFVYKKLFEQADFSKLSPTAKHAFDLLGTSDFERVIKALRDARLLLSGYAGVSQEVLAQLDADADGLKNL